MNVAEWILVVILSVTLMIFLITGIVFLVMMIGISKEVKKVVIESQDIAKNANGIVTNVRGMTSIGGTMELFINKYVMPKIKEKVREIKSSKERTKNGRED